VVKRLRRDHSAIGMRCGGYLPAKFFTRNCNAQSGQSGEAGKHIIIDKPLPVTLEEADQMVAACQVARVKLMYAEELCFAPKYERACHLVKEGAVGEIYLLKHCTAELCSEPLQNSVPGFTLNWSSALHHRTNRRCTS